MPKDHYDICLWAVLALWKWMYAELNEYSLLLISCVCNYFVYSKVVEDLIKCKFSIKSKVKDLLTLYQKTSKQILCLKCLYIFEVNTETKSCLLVL